MNSLCALQLRHMPSQWDSLLIMNVQTEGMWVKENANSSLYLARLWQSHRDFPFLTILSKLPWEWLKGLLFIKLQTVDSYSMIEPSSQRHSQACLGLVWLHETSQVNIQQTYCSQLMALFTALRQLLRSLTGFRCISTTSDTDSIGIAHATLANFKVIFSGQHYSVFHVSLFPN